MNDYSIFIGRQPILSRLGEIYAYELLYRNSEKNFFPDINPEQATIGLLINTFLSVGIDQVTSGVRSFINFSGELLAQDIFMSLNPDQVVIEILEDVEITPALLRRLRMFKEAGFTLALDDFILQDQYVTNAQLFELVDIIKVDFIQTSIAEKHRITTFLKRYPSIILLAEKVETEADYQLALKSGYDLFQGYFFAKPDIIKSAEIPSNTLIHLQIIDYFQQDSQSINQLSDLIMRDVSISYKLLRFINSLAFDIPRQISSIKQAIMFIGLNETKKWLQVLMLHDLGSDLQDGRVEALVELSLRRARACELLAKYKRKPNKDEYFLTGMFSLIDAVMRRKWEDILPLLSLSDVIMDTLNGKQTEMSPYMELIESVERFEWQTVERLSRELAIPKKELSDIFLQALRWSRGIEHEMN
ncbi:MULTISPECIES: EAL and HDOD domain-containing protein [unclassified Sporosarcina]|uniref:EAL and HDOD domain-containing protein n=1 Tax=unclassified Sporosarcina TaxID=2647733 RepID=UPI000C1719E7|nr:MULTISPECIES: HDOD domain-containing protein [unclassified Sporosarcina]PID04957.1 EAL domain-containing protein [Sporosarcina sp. P30]PID08216.1 EAL domain-containing protein [Sporosarcina sp. P31]PID11296.1 EAL domain-containing protein [Sporosarcina sp. P32b]